MPQRSSFLTLTYSDDELPEDQGLDVTHWQKFAKRVRKALGPFRFIHCGEYGGQTHRPHYHALVFGQDFAEDRVHWKGSGAHRLHVSPRLDELWSHGQVLIGDVSWTTASYVAGYVLDKITGPDAAYVKVDERTGECWEVRPPYVTMSRRPGLGRRWIDTYEADVYPSDEVVIEGKKYRPPQFYDDVVGEKDPVFMEAVKARRRARVDRENATPERLQTREDIMLARLEFSRNQL